MCPLPARALFRFSWKQQSACLGHAATRFFHEKNYFCTFLKFFEAFQKFQSKFSLLFFWFLWFFMKKVCSRIRNQGILWDTWVGKSALAGTNGHSEVRHPESPEIKKWEGGVGTFSAIWKERSGPLDSGGFSSGGGWFSNSDFFFKIFKKSQGFWKETRAKWKIRFLYKIEHLENLKNVKPPTLKGSG